MFHLLYDFVFVEIHNTYNGESCCDSWLIRENTQFIRIVGDRIMIFFLQNNIYKHDVAADDICMSYYSLLVLSCESTLQGFLTWRTSSGVD